MREHGVLLIDPGLQVLRKVLTAHPGLASLRFKSGAGPDPASTHQAPACLLRGRVRDDRHRSIVPGWVRLTSALTISASLTLSHPVQTPSVHDCRRLRNEPRTGDGIVCRRHRIGCSAGISASKMAHAVAGLSQPGRGGCSAWIERAAVEPSANQHEPAACLAMALRCRSGSQTGAKANNNAPPASTQAVIAAVSHAITPTRNPRRSSSSSRR